MTDLALSWRGMTVADTGALFAIANAVHPDFFEAREVLEERLSLYPAGCRLLEGPHGPAGYVLSHPWRLGHLPPLNARLGALPVAADTYYIHDLALLPVARGSGAAGRIVEVLIRHAAATGLPNMSLVAVNGSVGFWERYGFAVQVRPELADKLGSYEAEARYMVRPAA